MVGQVDDPLEQEADRVADRLFQAPEPALSAAAGPASVRRKCAGCEQEEVQRLSTKQEASARGAGMEAPEIVSETIRSPGRPLDAGTRGFFEARLGHDFSRVRIHADRQAAEANRSIGARAFAIDHHIAFGEGQYAPASDSGRRLLAHELTHVIQQSGGSHVVRGDFVDDLKKSAEAKAEAFAAGQLGKLRDASLGPPSGYTGDPKCGPSFCQPFTSRAVAVANLAWAGPLMLAGIAKKVNPRVVPLWASYLTGGSAPKDLSADFGKDFTASPTTARTTEFLVAELRKDVTANQSAWMGGGVTGIVDFTPRLSVALAAINDPAQPAPPQMNFNIPADIAGNVAGGIGKDETSFALGAKPSPFNDSREATVKAKLTRNADGSLTVAPEIQYTVKDTIDLCPGDCGTSAEQVATLPLSRFEASGVAGDVPMTIQFEAPTGASAPFTIPAPAPTPAPSPVSGTVTASLLHIRSAPDTASPIVGDYPKGAKITILCGVKGTVVDGVDTWYQTDKGFVSGRHVTSVGPTPPAPCKPAAAPPIPAPPIPALPTPAPPTTGKRSSS